MLASFLLVFLIISSASAAPLPECTIDFEDSCPDASPLCGATFSGGQGCFESDPLQQGLCSEQDRGYHLQGSGSEADLLTIEFAGDVTSLRIHFNSFTSGATMEFYDDDGVLVGQTVGSLHCRSSVPESRLFDFDRAVRRIEVSATGFAWIDGFHVNPTEDVATGSRSWTTVKARY